MQEKTTQIEDNSKKTTQVEDILSRLRVFFKVKTSKGVAEHLGVSEQAVHNWKKRNTIDYDLIREKAEGIDWNWLMTGGETTDLKSNPIYIRGYNDGYQAARIKMNEALSATKEEEKPKAAEVIEMPKVDEKPQPEYFTDWDSLEDGAEIVDVPKGNFKPPTEPMMKAAATPIIEREPDDPDAFNFDIP